MYQIEFKESVYKDLKKIEKKSLQKIFGEIEKLKISPYKRKIKRLIFQKIFFRIRAGNYRIIFQILDDEKEIIIFRIRHRKEVYKSLPI